MCLTPYFYLNFYLKHKFVNKNEKLEKIISKNIWRYFLSSKCWLYTIKWQHNKQISQLRSTPALHNSQYEMKYHGSVPHLLQFRTGWVRSKLWIHFKISRGNPLILLLIFCFRRSCSCSSKRFVAKHFLNVRPSPLKACSGYPDLQMGGVHAGFGELFSPLAGEKFGWPIDRRNSLRRFERLRPPGVQSSEEKLVDPLQLKINFILPII